jgi:pimeloyl-ACP methyl ester carboxylesterase
VLALDLPGHGKSDGPPLDSIKAMSDWLMELMSAVEAHRPAIVGHSMGSYVALQHAASQPDAILGLVLVGTSDRMRVHPELLDAAERRDPHAIDLMVGWMHTGTHRYGGHRNAGSWSAGISRATLERNLCALGGDLVACDRFEPTLLAPAITCRTLVVSGAADKMTRADAAGRLAGLIPGSEHVVIDGAGHIALSERSEPVNEAIGAFLEGLEAAS